MIKPIMRNELLLGMPSEPATEQDVPIGQDLLDTLAAHADSCVGMAANMIGVRKRIIGLGDKTGSVEVGKSADLIVLDANPLDDLEALRNVRRVMVRGRFADSLQVKHLPELDAELDKFLPR